MVEASARHHKTLAPPPPHSAPLLLGLSLKCWVQICNAEGDNRGGEVERGGGEVGRGGGEVGRGGLQREGGCGLQESKPLTLLTCAGGPKEDLRKAIMTLLTNSGVDTIWCNHRNTHTQ